RGLKSRSDGLGLPKVGAFTPILGTSSSSSQNVRYVRKFSTVSAASLATKSSQKLLSLSIASCSEPPPNFFFFGARPYQTISAHSAPADVPLNPTSLNPVSSPALFRSFRSRRILVSTPTAKAACIPPPWHPMATFICPPAFFRLDLTMFILPARYDWDLMYFLARRPLTVANYE